MAALSFDVTHQATGSPARRGILTLPHAVVETPTFMPVGTRAAVKALDPADLEAVGARLILGNAYHLMLRPGAEAVAERGGLHRFMSWGGAILTDSGGYQVFSLTDLRDLDDDGVSFRSHIDGALVRLTPERLVTVQEYLGPDIAMVLDECPPANAAREQLVRAVARTTAWAERCLAAARRPDVAWFGIVQGGTDLALRAEHAAAMRQLPFAGFAIGGVSVGEQATEIEPVVRAVAPLLPEGKPRYLMGVGTPQDLVRAVACGVDLFDCVMPTRNARNGQLFTSGGRIVIKHAAHRTSDAPVDARCDCSTCRRFSRAYLRHLFVSGELGYHRLATIHNLRFYLRLMERMRAAIAADCFAPQALLAELEGAGAGG